MKLVEWSWDDQRYIEVDYPDEIIQRFVNKLRTNKQWWQSPDPGRDVYSAMFRPFQQELADWRAAQQRAAPQETVAEQAAQVRAIDRMAHARAALAEKRKQQKQSRTTT